MFNKLKYVDWFGVAGMLFVWSFVISTSLGMFSLALPMVAGAVKASRFLLGL